MFKLAHDSHVNSATFSPDGTLLATASLDDTARLFEVASGQQLLRLAHGGNVHRAAFSPDGKLLATASMTARLFEVTSGKELARLAHDAGVSSVVFSPDGQALATASNDKTARLWRIYPTARSLVDAVKAKAARCLTQAQRKQYFLPLPPLLRDNQGETERQSG